MTEDQLELETLLLARSRASFVFLRSCAFAINNIAIYVINTEAKGIPYLQKRGLWLKKSLLEFL